MITSGELVAGGMSSANSLGESTGVPRTPPREAPLQLVRARDDSVWQERGARILVTTLTDLVEVIQIRSSGNELLSSIRLLPESQN